MVQAGTTGLSRCSSLLGLRFIQERGFAGPAFVGKSGELFDLRLADEILFLLFDARRMLSDMS
jgi:hypothetical protein